MMLDHLGEHEAAKAIVSAIERVLDEPRVRTRDLGGRGSARLGHGRTTGLALTRKQDRP